ncbi:MAG: threonine synthase [Defluviitaleaceae bacterium]|nr:threonine synthase [Defluviitaleaceae bacterium]
MNYVSTRDISRNKLSASQAIVNGLAPDGGLYVPCDFPRLCGYIGKSYEEIALDVLKLYLTDFTEAELQEAIALAYGENLPIKIFNEYVELFHGRTAAFKDLALQLFPYLLTLSLRKNNVDKTAVILTATSGDTGSAVISGMADVPNTRAIVFYPESGVSDIQKLQMTTQVGENIKVFAIRGNFDDAQTAVKEIFEDRLFQANFADDYIFTSANSINLARLLPQIVYYFYSYSEWVKMGRIKEGDAVNYVVPTGNFGNILAGYYAQKMGLPIGKLICATNTNNVLCDFIKTGTYNKNREFNLTLSPSMDILVSSNLERFIYDIAGCDAEVVKTAYASLKNSGTFSIAVGMPMLDAETVSDEDTLQGIKEVYDSKGYIQDPHTAVGQAAYNQYKKRTGDKTPTLILSTASPYKFPKAVESALGKVLDNPPESICSLNNKPILHNEVIDIQNIRQAIGGFLYSPAIETLLKNRRIFETRQESEDDACLKGTPGGADIGL